MRLDTIISDRTVATAADIFRCDVCLADCPCPAASTATSISTNRERPGSS
jgi:hypothetical protein